MRSLRTMSARCCISRHRPMSGSRSPTRRNIMRTMSAGALSLLRAMMRCWLPEDRLLQHLRRLWRARDMPIREDAPQEPVNPYGASKAMVERILDDYARAYGLGVVALRYFNACGADPDGEIGELRDPETHLIPRAMMAIQGHLADFAVFGTDYATADGTAVRDYVHVSDLADAHVASAAAAAGRRGRRKLQSRDRQRLFGEAGARCHRRRNRRRAKGAEGPAPRGRSACACGRCLPCATGS